MKKKFITLMICGAVVGTALVGVTTQNGKEWTSNSNKIINMESDDLDNKYDLVAEYILPELEDTLLEVEEDTLAEIDSIKAEATNKQIVSESKEKEVVMTNKSGQAKGENTLQKNATNYEFESKTEEIINNDNSTKEVAKSNNQLTLLFYL